MIERLESLDTEEFVEVLKKAGVDCRLEEQEEEKESRPKELIGVTIPKNKVNLADELSEKFEGVEQALEWLIGSDYGISLYHNSRQYTGLLDDYIIDEDKFKLYIDKNVAVPSCTYFEISKVR